MKLISGSSNLPLSKSISQQLNIPLIDVEISHFANGEKRVWIRDEVKGENIILVQSFSDPADENVMETLLLLDALERSDVKHINVVIPWMGYSLQDKVFRPGEPIAAKVVANILSNSYVHRVFLLDLHNSSIPGFFSVPTNHLSALQLFVEYVKKNFDLSNALIASPDFGGLKRARVFADTLGLDLVNIDKQRNLTTGEITEAELHGNVQGKDVILYDDVIVSGGTVVEAAAAIQEAGAKSVHFFSTHGIFAGEALQRIADSPLKSLVITNSISHPEVGNKIQIIDAAPLFADALKKWI